MSSWQKTSESPSPNAKNEFLFCLFRALNKENNSEDDGRD